MGGNNENKIVTSNESVPNQHIPNNMADWSTVQNHIRVTIGSISLTLVCTI